MSQSSSSEEVEWGLEAMLIKVYEIKENVPAKKAGKKATTRSLGFTRTEEHAKVVLNHLRKGSKANEKEAFLVRKKGEEEAEIFIKTKAIHCIFYVENHAKLPLETFHNFSKDQQRYLTLISEDAAAAADEEEEDDEE